MAEFARRDVARGINDGVLYAEQFGLTVPQEILAERLEPLEAALNSWADDLSERFVCLFATNYTIASISRIKYEKEPLTEEEARSYLSTAVWFFNSWSHR